MLNLSQRQVDRLLSVSGTLLLIIAFVMIAFYELTVPTEQSFGERFVASEISIFPFNSITTFKPITLITYFIFAGIILILEANRNLKLRVDTRGLRAVLLAGAFGAGYEFVWNLFAWFATWQKTGGQLDLAVNTFHAYSSLPANFNFATKVSFLVFALCLYSWTFLNQIQRQQNQPSQN